MGLSQSPLSYEDTRLFLEMAFDAKNGARKLFETRQEATAFLQRCYKNRDMDRKKSKSIFEPGDAMYGVSVYDDLAFTKEEVDLGKGKIKWSVVAFKRSATALTGVETF